MREELKPCPFHGCGARLIRDGGLSWIECDDFDCNGPAHETDAEAIAGWNTRSNPPQEERSDPLDLAAADNNHKGVLASFTIKVRQDGTDVHSRVENLVRPEFALWTAIGALAQESASLGSCPFAHKIMLLPDLVTVAKWRAATVLPPEVSEALNTVLRAANDKSPIADNNHKALVEALAELVRYAPTAMQQEAVNVAPYQAAIRRAKAALAAFQSRQEEK